MFNFLKKNRNKVEETAIDTREMKIFAVFKLKLPELHVECLKGCGDASISGILNKFEAKIKVPAFALAPWLAFNKYPFNNDKTIERNQAPILFEVYDKLVKFVRDTTLSREAAHLLLLSVHPDYDALLKVFVIHSYSIVFEDGTEIAGNSARDVLDRAENIFKGVESKTLRLLRSVVAEIEK